MLDRVARTIRLYRMFGPGQRVGVAVSGGADSVCLLHVLFALRPEWDLTLTVLHLNHCLRGQESAADAAFVRDLAGTLGLPFEYAEVDVRRIAADSSENLEQAGRLARQEFFAGVLARFVDRVATGHTRSDQAETVLQRLLRGSGTAGLAAIRPVTSDGLVRPLIAISREEARRWLQDRCIPWREDATNADPSFARNRIRHEILPSLAHDFNPNLEETLARMATIAQDEEEYWAAIIEPLAAVNFRLRPPALIFNAEWLAGLPRAVARRVVRRAIGQVRAGLRGLDFAHFEQVLQLAAVREGSRRFQAPGIDIFRSFDWIRIAPPTAAERPDYEIPVAVPGEVEVPATGAKLQFTLVTLRESKGLGQDQSSTSSVYNRKESELEWERIFGTLHVRNWRPGDHYQPEGRTGDVKLKTLFQEARIPVWERRTWPVVTCGNELIWAPRFGPAAQYRATSTTRVVLRVCELGSLTEI